MQCECASTTTASALARAAEISALRRLRSFGSHHEVRPSLSAVSNEMPPKTNVPGASGAVKPASWSSAREPLSIVAAAISFNVAMCAGVTKYFFFHRSRFMPGRPGESLVVSPARESGWNVELTDMNATRPFGVSMNAGAEASWRSLPVPQCFMPAFSRAAIVMNSPSFE